MASLTLHLISLLQPATRIARPLVRTEIDAIVTYAFWSTGNQIALFLALHTTTNIATPAFVVLPRNLMLLWAATLGRNGISLDAGRSQMSLALAVGTSLWLMADRDLTVGWQARMRSWDLPRLLAERMSTRFSNLPDLFKIACLTLILPTLILMFVFFDQEVHKTPSTSICALLPAHVRSQVCTPQDLAAVAQMRSVDLVFSYFEEDIDASRNTSEECATILSSRHVSRGYMYTTKGLDLQMKSQPLSDLGRVIGLSRYQTSVERETRIFVTSSPITINRWTSSRQLLTTRPSQLNL